MIEKKCILDGEETLSRSVFKTNLLWIGIVIEKELRHPFAAEHGAHMKRRFTHHTRCIDRHPFREEDLSDRVVIVLCSCVQQGPSGLCSKIV